MCNDKRGSYFFIIDVIMGIFIFVLTIILLSTFYSSSPALSGAGQTIDNIYQESFLTPISDIGTTNPGIEELRALGYIHDTTITIDQLILSLNKTYDFDNETVQDFAWNIFSNMTSWVPEQYGVLFVASIDDSPITLYLRESALATVEESQVGISRYKICALSPSMDVRPKPNEAISIFEVYVWQ